MKTCPNCQMTTDAHSECSICGYDITDVSYNEKGFEKYSINKNFLKFLFKKRKFQLICIAVAITSLILTLPSFNAATFGAILLSIVCFVTSLYRNFFIKLGTWKYSEHYLEVRHNIFVALWGALAIVFAILSVALKYAEIIYQQTIK